MKQYKDSGIDWIGRIPEGWKINKFKHLFRIKKIIAGKLGYDVLSVTQQGLKVKNITSNEGQVANDYTNYQLVFPNDFVMNHMDLLTGYVDVSKQEGVTSPDYRTFYAIHPKDIINQYYLYIFQFCYKARLFYNLGQGVSNFGRWRLPAEQQKEFMLPFPPTKEQVKIAEYLDEKCGEIDSLIELQEQMIEKLKAYKQSVITEAVTKGLDLNAKLVPSGIDWIGEVPAGWKVCRIKDISSINSNSLNENTQSDFEFDYVDIGSVSFEQGIYKSEHYLFKDAPSRARKKANLGDIVMSTVRTYLRAIDVVDTVEKSQYIYSTGFAIITPKANVLSSFLSYITKSDCFLKQVIVYSKGINYPSINTNELMAISVALPPISEQTIIAEYLSKKCKEIDVLVSIKQQKIEKLKDYKKSIICEAVTGKIIIES
jgi:type I restriction enzyme S subunit